MPPTQRAPINRESSTQGIVDQIEVASDPDIYTTLETDLFSQMHSTSCELYFWNHHNPRHYIRVSKYNYTKNEIFYSDESRRTKF
jgi:hypothetical protein